MRINFYSDGITLHPNKENKVNHGWDGGYTGPKELVVADNKYYIAESGFLWKPKIIFNLI